MGYESKIFIVYDTPLMKEENKNFAFVVAMFNLSKMNYDGPFHKLLEKSKRSNCYIYIGDKKIEEDKYGEDLIEIDLDKLIDVLSKEDKEYRRIEPLLMLLKQFKKDIEKWPDLKILHYGY